MLKLKLLSSLLTRKPVILFEIYFNSKNYVGCMGIDLFCVKLEKA